MVVPDTAAGIRRQWRNMLATLANRSLRWGVRVWLYDQLPGYVNRLIWFY